MQNPLNNYLNYPAKKKLHILKKTTFCDVVKQKKNSWKLNKLEEEEETKMTCPPLFINSNENISKLCLFVEASSINYHGSFTEK